MPFVLEKGPDQPAGAAPTERFVLEEAGEAAPEPERKGLGAARFLGPLPALADYAMRNPEAAESLWNMVKPGQDMTPPSPPERLPGESSRDYAARAGHAALREMASPEGIDRAMRMVGYTLPGASLLRRKQAPVPPGTPPTPAGASATGGAAGSQAAGGAAAAQGGGAGAQSAATVVIRPPKRGIVEKVFAEPAPIPEAQYLLERGARLTKGMYDPQSSRNLVELATTSRPGAGPLIAKQRAQALEDAMGLGFQEAAPPGASVKLSGGINDKYATLKSAWDEAYDAVRASGEKIYPAVHGDGGGALRSTANKPGLLDQIVNDAGEIWDDQSRAIAKRFIDNQMSRLPEPKGALGRVDLGDMLTVLSNVKQAGREALKSQRYDLHQIMGRFQEAIEQTVESQASPATSATLRALNAKYRDFKVMEDAVIRAGDSPAGITPSRLAASVKAMEPSRSRYAAGGGGSQRELSQAISKVFDTSASPPTGARLLAAMPDWVHSGLLAPTIYLRNTAAARAAGGVAGATGGSAAARAAGGAASAWGPTPAPVSPQQQNALLRLLLEYESRPGANQVGPAVNLLRLRLGLPPVAAEEEGR